MQHYKIKKLQNYKLQNVISGAIPEQKFVTVPTFVQNFVSFVQESFSITVKNVVFFPQA